MKNIQLIAFLFVLNLFGGGVICLNAQEASAKVSLPFMELRGAVDLKNLKWNYGALLTTQKLFPKVPVTIKAGNLSAGGSLSKLNSPALSSSVSAFLPSSVKANDLDVSLPSYNSFSSPQSYSLEAGYKPGNFIKQLSLSLFYKPCKDDEESLTSSVMLNIVPVKKVELVFCSTAGIFTYKKKTISTWFSNEKYYGPGKHFCINNQVSLVTKKFSTLFIQSTYQSPFGNFYHTWRTENLLKAENFSFNLNAFYNPNDFLITSSDKKLKPLFQVGVGGQYKCLIHSKNPVSITTGISTQADINLSEQNHSLKTSSGITYSNGYVSGSFITKTNLNLTNQTDGIKTDFSSGSVQTSNTFYLGDFYPGISGKFTFTPDSKKTYWTFTEEIGLSFEYKPAKGVFNVSNNNKITFTQKTKDMQKKINFTSSLTAKAQFRFCSLRVHLEFQV